MKGVMMGKRNLKLIKESLRTLPLVAVERSALNPRVIDKKGAAFLELVRSVKANGVLVPIHVRPADNHDKYILLAGERRVLASITAGLTEIAGIVHEGLTDAEAFEITFTENFSREDLTPIEQSNAVALLLGRYEDDAKAVAAKLGRSIVWVKMREAIHKNLSPAWLKAASEDNFWTSAHLSLIARCPKHLQAELFEEFGNTDKGGPKVNQVEKFIADEQKLLLRAPWLLDEPIKVRLGVKNKNTKTIACVNCPKRTGFQPELWDLDPNDAKACAKNDRCMDPFCWQQRYFIWLERKATELRATMPNLQLICTEYIYGNEEMLLADVFGDLEIRRNHRYDITNKKNKKAMPALVIFGSDMGQIKYIITEGSGGVKSDRVGKGRPKTLSERRDLHKSKRWNKVLEKMDEKIHASKVKDIQAKDKSLALLSLAFHFGTAHDCMMHREKPFKCFAEEMKGKPLAKIREQLFHDIKPRLCELVHFSGPITQVPKHRIEAARSIARILDIDIELMLVEQVTALPEPKSWKTINADGSKKTATKKAPKKAAKKKTTKKKKC